ncbi:uncharacterized protein [Malus domestica]|uniref:uncharacterized protein isoform X2 n=1 Tax=Malus domestica TaxID=3750 RepID=UPI00397637C8
MPVRRDVRCRMMRERRERGGVVRWQREERRGLVMLERRERRTLEGKIGGEMEGRMSKAIDIWFQLEAISASIDEDFSQLITGGQLAKALYLGEGFYLAEQMPLPSLCRNLKLLI